MERNIDVFRKLPYEVRRYILLLVRTFHRLGYQLSRPRALDMRVVRPVNDFDLYPLDLGNRSLGQWVGLEHDGRIATGRERGKFRRGKHVLILPNVG